MPVSLYSAQSEIRLNEREQMQYLLGGPPSWMMRYGIAMFACFFTLVLCLSYVIRYPDVLESKVMLTTSNPPVRVPALAGGQIVYLPIQEHQNVRQGDILAVLENPARWEDVLRLEEWLRTADNDRSPLPSGLRLGTLQNVYSTFSQHWKDYEYFNRERNAYARIDLIRTQIEQLEKINANLTTQNALLREEFNYTSSERGRQQQLHNDAVISDQAFEKSEAAWLAQKRQLAVGEASLLQNQMQIQQFREQMEELSLNSSDQMHEKQLSLTESKQQLISAIAAWKQTFVLTAPVGGIVSFSTRHNLHESLETGEELVAIIPDKMEKMVARARVPAAGLGGLNPGDRAVVYLDAWPVQQYGSLEGRLTDISAIPAEEGYLIEVALPDDLVTTYGKTIPFRQEMSGQVRIVTQDRRISDRIFDRFSDLVKNR